MSDRPSAYEAEEALRQVREGRGRGVRSVRQAPWVGVVMGAAVFALLAAPDFFGAGVQTWVQLGFTAVVAAYWLMTSTRRGSAALGRPTRLRRQDVSPRFARWARTVLIAVMLIGLAALFVPHGHLSVPYLRTGLGAVLGLALAVFGGRLQKALGALAAPRDDTPGDAVHGPR
jgi:hypothetical protein